MNLAKLDKDLKAAQEGFGTLLSDYHMVMLNPKLDDKTQALAIEYYTKQIKAIIGLMADFSKHYRTRPEVEATLIASGLELSDEIEKLLGQQTFENLLEVIEDDPRPETKKTRNRKA
jgi:hypothetical protein